MVELGEGVNTAFIYDRRGESRLLDLPPSTGISWERLLSDVSAGEVTVPVRGSGAATRECCRQMGDIHTWAHSLVVFRDDERVWEGPIRRVKHSPSAVTFSAVDVLGWAKRRRVHTSRVVASANVVSEASLAVTRAFAPDNPNVTAHMQVIAGGGNVARDVAINSGYYYDDLASLVDGGAHFTTLGRRIIIFPDGYLLGRTRQLDLDEFVLADIEVTEEGDAATTAATARDDNAHSATVGGVDAYYGLLDTITSPGPGNFPAAGLTAYAQTTRNQTYPAPLVITVPEDARLSRAAPVELSHLVCGVVVPVVTRATCVDVRGTSVLTGVKVTQTPTDGEVVSISLSPVSQAAAA